MRIYILLASGILVAGCQSESAERQYDTSNVGGQQQPATQAQCDVNNLVQPASGIVAEVSVLDPNVGNPLIDDFWNFNLPSNKFSPAVSSANRWIQNDVFFPNQMSSDGMLLSTGDFLRDPDLPASAPFLQVNFSLGLQGVFRADADGLYQFGTISDDGSRLEIFENNAWKVLLNDNAAHPEQLNCADLQDRVPLKKGEEVKFRMFYYQGPPVQIAFSFLVKRWDASASATQDPLCGLGGFHNAYTTPPTQLQNFTDLLSRDWEVVPAANLFQDFHQSCD